GTYLLSGGSVTPGAEQVGYAAGAAGTFNQNGGTNNCTSIYLGSGVSGNGFGTGTYLLSNSGAIHSTGNIAVGAGGAGTFIQNGGTIQINADLNMANVPGTPSTGYYALQSGTLNVAGNEIVGGYDGAVTSNQTGGQNSTKFLYIGSLPGAAGTYLLSGGTLTVAVAESLDGSAG